MTKTTMIVGLLSALTLTTGAASAQTMPAPLTKGFLNVNVGAQPQTRVRATLFMARRPRSRPTVMSATGRWSTSTAAGG